MEIELVEVILSFLVNISWPAIVIVLILLYRNELWAGYNLMYTIDVTVRGGDPALILNGIDEALQHIHSLGFNDTAIERDLTNLRDGVWEKVNEQWATGMRSLYAEEFKKIAVRIGAQARDHQIDQGHSYP